MSDVPNSPLDARQAVVSVDRNDSYLPSPVQPPVVIAARQPGDPPTRERKLKATTFEQVDAARELIRPQPMPKHKARKFGASAIVFEPDHTPADTEARLDPPAKKRKPGPAPRSASPEEKQRQQHIRAIRAEISPQPAPPLAALACDATDAPPASPPVSPSLSDAEMDQIVGLVQDKYGPILDITQAAEVSRLAKQTIRERVCHGLYAGSVVRGRPLRFWTHRFVREVMQP